MSRPLASLGGHYSESACRTSLKIAFENGPVGKDCQAKGNARVELAARGINGGTTMTKSSSPIVGKKLPLHDEQEFAEKFSPVIEDMNLHRVSKATGRSVETVKAWRARRAFPNGASLINAARAFPSVKAWLLEQIDAPAQPDNTGDITKMMQGLDRLAAGSGPNADMARAILQEMHKPRGARE